MTLLKVKQKRSLQRRSRILRAAARVLGDRGVHAATLTEISRKAKVPLSSLYDYFPDKTQLIASLPEATFRQFYAEIDAALQATPDALQQLRIFYLRTLAHMERDPAWARVFFLEIWPSVLVREPKVRRAVDGYGRRVIDIIQAGIASRQLARSNDPYLLMSIILGSMTHLVAVWLLYRKPYCLQAQGERALALLLPTIVPASGKARRHR